MSNSAPKQVSIRTHVDVGVATNLVERGKGPDNWSVVQVPSLQIDVGWRLARELYAGITFGFQQDVTGQMDDHPRLRHLQAPLGLYIAKIGQYEHGSVMHHVSLTASPHALQEGNAFRFSLAAEIDYSALFYVTPHFAVGPNVRTGILEFLNGQYPFQATLGVQMLIEAYYPKRK